MVQMNDVDKVEIHNAAVVERFDFTAVLMEAFYGKTTDDLVVEFDEDDAPYEPHKGGGFI
jgi:hypothetical protein